MKEHIPQDRFSHETEQKICSVLGCERVSYPNIFGPQKEYRRFIILSTQRSGSSYLSNLLQSHPEIVCYSELFHPDRCSFDYPFFPEDQDESVLMLRKSEPEKFLKELIFRGYEANFRAVGFKVQYSQLEDPRFESAVKWLYNENTLAVIHLIRNNFLDTLVSHKLALATREWWKTDPRIVREAKRLGIGGTDISETDIPEFDILQIEISVEEMLNYFEQMELQIVRYRERFTKHPVLEVAYEDLVMPDAMASSGILNFLGVAPAPLFSRIVKQKKRSNQEILTNFTVLKKACEGTRWSVFFG